MGHSETPESRPAGRLNRQRAVRVLIVRATYPVGPAGRPPYPLRQAYLVAAIREQVPFARVEARDHALACSPLSTHEYQSIAGNYDLVVFSVDGRSELGMVNEWCAAVRAESRPPMVVVDDFHALACPDYGFPDYAHMDIIQRGHAEWTMVSLVQACWDGRDDLGDVKGIAWRNNGRVVVNESFVPSVHDVDVLAVPGRDAFGPLSRYSPPGRLSAEVWTTRGCVHRCSFCLSHTYEPRGEWLPRSPEKVLDECEELAGCHGVAHIAIMDDNFLTQPDHSGAIVEGLQARRLSVTFSFLARADDIVRCANLLPGFRNAGCSTVEIGIENMSDRVLARFDKETSAATNRKALRVVADAGITARLHYILWEPEMTRDDLQANLDFIEEAPVGRLPLLFTELTPFWGTPMYERLCRKGLVRGSRYDPTVVYENAFVGRARRFVHRIESAIHDALRASTTACPPRLLGCRTAGELPPDVNAFMAMTGLSRFVTRSVRAVLLGRVARDEENAVNRIRELCGAVCRARAPRGLACQEDLRRPW
jgi:hypothetical protein